LLQQLRCLQAPHVQAQTSKPRNQLMLLQFQSKSLLRLPQQQSLLCRNLSITRPLR
jgi:hypothetical protein